VKENQQHVKVECLTQGLKLRFDGYVCDIKVPQVSYNKQCGLCGLSSLELRSKLRNNEFFGTSDLTSSQILSTHDVPNLFIKYVTNDCRYSKFQSDEECTGYNCPSKRFSSLFWPETEDETCDEINFPYIQTSKLFSDDLFERSPRWLNDEIFGENSDDILTDKFEYTSSQRRPLLKHKVVEREDEVCVSLERIPQCPVNSYPESKIQKRIPYKCVSRNDQRVWQFESRIRLGERIPEIHRSTPSLIRTEVVPLKCSNFY
jgi:hypothetical protein